MRYRSISAVAAGGVLAGMLVLSSCVTTEESADDSLSLDEPWTVDGIVSTESDPDAFNRWVQSLEDEREDTGGTDRQASAAVAKPTQRQTETTNQDVIHLPWPSEGGHLQELPRLNATELVELLDAVVLGLKTEGSYTDGDPVAAAAAPPLPEGAGDERVLTRESSTGRRILRFGYWQYQSRPPQLAMYGGILRDGQLEPNPDLANVEQLLNDALYSVGEGREGLSTQDLEKKIIQLSYIGMPGAMSALRGLGINTVAADAKEFPKAVPFEELPLVVELPAPDSSITGLVGVGSEILEGEFGSVTPAVATQLPSQVVASPASRLLVHFHPAHPEQFSRVKELLNTVIDRPARQIFIESMVLEISDFAIKDLGLEWEFRDGKADLSVGSLVADISQAVRTLSLDAAKDNDFSSNWAVRLRSLLIDGEIRVLSRPSVLALNDRQATIRIGDDFPIATSQEGLSGNASKIAFDFKYLSLGVLLNIRPRVNEAGDEISLMVDTMVSSRVPEGDLEIRDEDGTLLASAPRVDSRRVQTYARVQNNTPFIIGGLVNRRTTETVQRVPILGSIPFLGALFRTKSFDDVRREVIIVLTPYVVPEELHLSRALPAGDIDSKDNRLLRNAHRIHPGDIADISFLYINKRYETYRNLAREAVRTNFRLGEREPFRSFTTGRVPGGQVLVDTIVFNTLERLGAAADVETGRIIVLTSKYTGGYEVTHLDEVLQKRQVGDDLESFFTKNPDKALALSFYDPYETTGEASLTSDPVPEQRIVDCADRRDWRRLVWELNRPWPDGRTRYTILLHREEDVERLRLAIKVKATLAVNGGRDNASILDFIPGRMVEVPDISTRPMHLIDAEIARYFFHATHSYAKTIEEIESALVDLDRELRRPEHRLLMQGVELPPLETKK